MTTWALPQAGPTVITDGMASGIQAQCGASPRSGLQRQRASVAHPSTRTGELDLRIIEERPLAGTWNHFCGQCLLPESKPLRPFPLPRPMKTCLWPPCSCRLFEKRETWCIHQEDVGACASAKLCKEVSPSLTKK